MPLLSSISLNKVTHAFQVLRYCGIIHIVNTEVIPAVDKKTKYTTSKKQPKTRKRPTKKDTISTAKMDASNFARSIGSFIPGVGTILGIQSIYSDGMKLLESGPLALKELGKKSKERIESRIRKRLKRQ
jgi:hypothetical protein